MGDINKMIQWMKDREGKVSYSMAYRLGPNSYDCSSAVYFSLIAGGFLPTGSMGNTDSLFQLVGSLLQPISRNAVERGDIFIAGVKNGSGGAAGHTGIFLENNKIIHCTPAVGNGGIVTTPANGWMGDSIGLPVYFYRLKGATNNTNNTDNKVGEGEGDVDMYLIFTIDTKRWYVSNGVTVRYIKNVRFLDCYQGKWAKLNLKVDKMYQGELEREFGKV